MFEEARQVIVDSINDLLIRDLIPEAIAFVTIILSGLILSWILRIGLKRIKRTLDQGQTLTLAPWLRHGLDLSLQVARPFSI